MQYTAAELASICGGELICGDGDTIVTGVAIDSRVIQPGQAFVALRGERVDGHNFVEQAFQRGASVAIVSRQAWEPAPSDGKIVIKVKDGRQALANWANFHRRRFRVPVIAVTGSVGKTTTKDMIASVLGQKFNVLKSPGNYNTELGVPLGILQWRDSHGAAVFELAMRGRGQIRYLAQILQPDVGVITNVGPTHLAELGSMEAIAQAKAELVESLPETGLAVLNADDPWVRTMGQRSQSRVFWYGLNSNADIYAKDLDLSDPYRTRFRLVWPRGEVDVTLPVPGRHQVLNALAAAAVAFNIGLSSRDLVAGLAAFVPEKQRLQIHRLPGEIIVLDDSYNASPASLVAALNVAAAIPRSGRLIVVLGDMLELGSMEEQAHREAGGQVAEVADLLLAYGSAMSAAVASAREQGMAVDGARHYSTQADLIDDLLKLVANGDVVMVKGSRGMKMENAVKALLTRFTRG